MNRIAKLPPKIFHTLSNMDYLNLSFNLIYTFEVDIGRSINVSNNALSELSSQTRQNIDSIPKSSNLTIDLNDNRLACSCQTLPFLNWINVKRGIFDGFHHYTCILNNQTSVVFTQLDQVIRQLEKNCSNYTGLIAGVLSAIALSITLVVCGLVYIRWKLRYLYYVTKNKYRG